MVRPSTVPATLLAGLLAAGCGAIPETGPSAQENGRAPAAAPAAPADGVRLALLTPSNDSDLSATEGYLRVEGPCLYLTDDNDGGRTLPAFSIPGVRWDADHNLLVAHGKTFAPGQRVVLGGSLATDGSLLTWVQPPDPGCDSTSIFVTGMIDAAPEPPPRR